MALPADVRGLRALADPTRRRLRDLLRAEAASLVTNRKVGGGKLHYLNAAPLQQISDRWISRYSAPYAPEMVELEQRLEIPAAATSPQNPKQAHKIIIRASAEAVWDALTNGALTRHYYYGTVVACDWRAADSMLYRSSYGSIMFNWDVI